MLGVALIILAVFYPFSDVQMSGANVTERTYPNEIRGVFIYEELFGVSHDWNVIAETLANYGINAVFVCDQGSLARRPDTDIRAAIDAFHAHNIKYHSCFLVLGETKPPGTSYGTEAITYNGEVYSAFYHCPIKVRNYTLSSLRDYLETFPDVDGICLDYARYPTTQDVCYCPHCRAAFQEWLGHNVTNWEAYYPTGDEWLTYAEWRTEPVTQLVKDIHDLIKSINPNILISEAAWTYFSDCPIYWRKFIGQDTGRWIAEGYIDFVIPMMYTKEIYGSSGDSLESYINADLKYMVGGVNGKVPLIAGLRCDWKTSEISPEEFAPQIDYVRSRGLNGWVLWQYGGPGGEIPGVPDIRDYLELIDMSDYFEIYDLQVGAINDTAMAITWRTTIPTTGTVEYAESSLWTSKTSTWSGFKYYYPEKNSQTKTVTDEDKKTEHYIVLIGLQPQKTYYFRVLSSGSGTAFTPEYTFIAGEGGYIPPPTDTNPPPSNQTSPPPSNQTEPNPPFTPPSPETPTFSENILAVKAVLFVFGSALIYVSVKRGKRHEKY